MYSKKFSSCVYFCLCNFRCLYCHKISALFIAFLLFMAVSYKLAKYSIQIITYSYHFFCYMGSLESSNFLESPPKNIKNLTVY